MKKGFTLVELLAVIAILAIVATITITVITPIINSSKKSLSKTQIAEIEKAAKEYFLANGLNLDIQKTCDDDVCVETTCISLSELISSGYIESKSIKDVYNDKDMNGSVTIKYESNQYTYKYKEKACE